MSHLKIERLAISTAQQCTDFRDENQMKLCKLPIENISNIAEASAKVKRFSFGKPNQLKCQTKKTVLLTGETGSGKTTWINAMVNYVLGVEWDDPFRFILIDEEVRGGSQANSQTQGVTVYDLHYQDGFRIPFSLTIVDTPGFGDTGGTGRDREIISEIEQLFKDDKSIEELEAVGFVVQSPLARLTQSQKYIFSVIVGMFANDVKENIRFLVTFCDGRKPPVLEAIKEAKLACQTDSKGLPCYQKFNNGAIYVNNQDEEDNMSTMEWNNGMKNFKSFFQELLVMPTKSLQETKEILRMANNDTRMLVQGATVRHDAIAKMKRMLIDVDNIRKTLTDLKMEVEKFQQDINISKTVGTATNVVGAGLAVGGCALAFLTGGVSLVLTFGGLAATLTGTGVNVGADLADKFWTKGYLETITNLASSLQKCFEELEMSLTQYWTIVQWLKQSHGLDENWSASLFQQLGKCKQAQSVTGNVAAFAMAGELYRTIEIAKSVGTLTTTATGGTSYVITKTLSELTAVETEAVRNILTVARTGATVLGKVLEGSVIALNVGTVVFDIVSLVKSWTNNHPAVIAIDDLSDKLNLLENEIKQKLSTMEEVH